MSSSSKADSKSIVASAAAATGNSEQQLPILEYLGGKKPQKQTPPPPPPPKIIVAAENSAVKIGAGSGFIVPPAEQVIDFYGDLQQRQSNTTDKFKSLARSNPLVPLGVLATVAILINGIFAMKNKDTVKSQRMMRYRVMAQGATVLALVAGTLIIPALSSKSLQQEKQRNVVVIFKVKII